ncbi:MAG: SDR family oxidoreductase [Myxococcota bacterium]
MGKLDGRVALITGGARGQGEAEARLFASEGARVVLADLLDPVGEKLAKSIGAAARYVHLDVTKPEEWARVVAGIEAAEGRLDVLVNNAGIFRGGFIHSMPLADYQAVIQVNQVGCFLGMQACYPLLKRSGQGSIVNIASVAGIKGVPGASAYGASKWAIRGMTKTAALEFGRAKIRVNAICPGSIRTPMIAPEEFPGVDQQAFWASLPIPRPGEAGEVAKLALFLACDDSAYMTGADFTIDGGDTVGRMVEGID